MYAQMVQTENARVRGQKRADKQNIVLLLLFIVFFAPIAAFAQTYWLNSFYNESEAHYPTAEEACFEGELQRRLEIHQAGSSLQHRISTIYLSPDSGIGERICQGVIQRRQYNLWLPVEQVFASVYGPLGQTPVCPLEGTADADSGQCLIPKCDDDCPPDGGNPSNPIASASGHKRHTETDYQGAGIFPLTFTRAWNSHRAAAGHTSPLGTGWTHNYSARLSPIPDSTGQITRIRAHRPNGAIQTFTLQGGQWQPDADVPERLTVTLTSEGQLQTATYHRRNDTLETYNPHGRLTTITNSDGHAHTLSYNGAQLHTITDPQGRTLQLTYNSAGQLTTLTSPDGTTGYSYDPQSRLTSVTHPDNTTRAYHWGEAQHPGSTSHPQFLTGITGENGQRIATWAYDSQQRGILSTHGPHNAATDRTIFQYHPDGTTTITDSLGQARTYQFTTSHGTAHLASLSAPCDTCANTAKTKTYDSNGYSASSTDFDNVTTQTTFDAQGRQTQKIEAAGTAQQRQIHTDWLADTHKATEQRTYNALGTLVQKTTYTRNSRSQPLTVTTTDPATNQSRTHSYSYCENTTNTCPHIGLLQSSTDANGHTTQYSYHAENGTYWRKGDLHTITNALGHTTEYQQYDAAGRPLRVQDANGLITHYQYNAKGQPSHISQSDGATQRTTTIAYTPAGDIQTITLPGGSALHYQYDNIQRLTKISDNLGNSIRYALDSAGNRTAERIYDANNTLRHSLSRSYTLLGRLQSHTDAVGASSQYQYTQEGQHSQTTDPLGHITRYHYDPLKRLQDTVQDASAIEARIHHIYNALSQRTQTTDPKGLVTGYKYNALGDLLAQDNPDTGTTKYAYDGAGNVIAKTDANGHTTHYSHDALHRVTAAANPNITYQYDSAPSVCNANESYHTGRLAQMHDASGSTSYCYNRFGDLTRKVQNTDGTTLTLQYSYHSNGQLHTIQYPDGTLIDHIYDSAGRIQEIGSTKIPQPRQIVVINIQYAPFGEPTQWQYGNGRILTRTLDQNYRHTHIHDSAADGLNIQYAYDAAGNITQLQTGNTTQQLHYDGLDRLLNKNNENYSWDKTGNRLSFSDNQGTHTYDYPSNNHRLQAVNGTNRAYDDAGNTTAIGTNTSFQYDADNRLASVTRNGLTTWYLYNGHGERVSRKSETDGSIARSLYLEDGRWLGDYDYQAGQPIQQIVWLHDWPVAVLDYQTTAEALHYIEPDHLGTPRVVIEQDRNLAVWTWAISGEAFGNTPPDEDPDGDGIAFPFDMRFPGQRYDNASGLNYNYFRDYEAGTGRYAQSDPIGLAGGLATYSYANGNPGRYIDPRGQAAIGICVTPLGFQACRTVVTWTVRKTIIGCGIVLTWVLSEGGGEGTGESGSGDADSPPPKNRFPDRELPRSSGGEPIPDPEAKGSAHTQLGQTEGRKGKYDQAREFDAQGKPVRDIDFTDHGRPKLHTNPHQHEYIENSTGGTRQRGPGKPLN